MSASPQDFPFSPDRLRAIDSLEKWHFWFWGRHQWVSRVRQRLPIESHHVVLDLGCGTGRFFRTIYPQARVAVGLDIRPEGLQQTRIECPDGLLIQAHAADLPLKDGVFDYIFMQDVLEHIEDDQVTIHTLWQLLRPGGALLITVPALPSMWSYRDVAAGHFRRYTMATLTELLTEEEFDLLDSTYFMCLLLPVLWIMRRLGRQDPKMRDLEEINLPVLNGLLKKIVGLEFALGRWIRWPIGSSIILVASRPKESNHA